jgi:hypothetical protein
VRKNYQSKARKSNHKERRCLLLGANGSDTQCHQKREQIARESLVVISFLSAEGNCEQGFKIHPRASSSPASPDFRKCLELLRAGGSLASPARSLGKPLVKLGEGFEQLALAGAGQIAEISNLQTLIRRECGFYRFEEGCDAPETSEARSKRFTFNC